ncbi:MAG: hypothetical protein ACYTG0_45080 [Planctomycetota bacterium]|jgi:hypothetical protein
METTSLEKQFARMGARLVVNQRPSGFAVDVRRDKDGSLFEIALDRLATLVSALDVQPRQRHLLLAVRRGQTHKFLCGHDERDWFAAAVPEVGGVSNVRAAMEALKPSEVRAAQVRQRVKRQRRNRRRNAAFVRQGEWFFIPAPDLVVDPLLVLRNEPLSRGRGKPHTAEFLCRTGGETVYVCREHPQGLSETSYRRLLARNPTKKQLRWITMRRNPEVYVRGRVRHPDHKRIELNGWHRVFTNTENRAAAVRHLVFLD